MCKNDSNSDNNVKNENLLDLEMNSLIKNNDLNTIKSENNLFIEINKIFENIDFKNEDVLDSDDSNIENNQLELLKTKINSIKQIYETKNILIKSLYEKMNFIYLELNKRNTLIEDLLDSISFKDDEIDNLNQIIIEKDNLNIMLKNEIDSINQDQETKEKTNSIQINSNQYNQIKDLRDKFNNEINIITKESNKKINEYMNRVKLLEENISDYKNKNIHLNNTIKTKDLMNNNLLKENKKLKEYLVGKDKKINKLIDISKLNEIEDQNFSKLEHDEMKKTIETLSNEIKILKSSIHEKNKLIESLKESR